MPDIIQAVRGEGCLEVPFASFWKALRRPHAQSYPTLCSPVVKHSFKNIKKVCSHMQACSVMANSATPRTVARYAPLSMGYSRQEYSSRLSFPLPG